VSSYVPGLRRSSQTIHSYRADALNALHTEKLITDAEFTKAIAGALPSETSRPEDVKQLVDEFSTRTNPEEVDDLTFGEHHRSQEDTSAHRSIGGRSAASDFSSPNDDTHDASRDGVTSGWSARSWFALGTAAVLGGMAVKTVLFSRGTNDT
jgi:hypothetical protein